MCIYNLVHLEEKKTARIYTGLILQKQTFLVVDHLSI